MHGSSTDAMSASSTGDNLQTAADFGLRQAILGLRSAALSGQCMALPGM